MKTLLLLTLTLAIRAFSAELENLHARYRTDGIRAEGAEIRSWENAAASGAGKALSKVVGEPRAWLVNTPGGERSVVRLDGKSALWQTSGAWGSLTGSCTVVALVRVAKASDGFLFDGSTRSGMTRLQTRGHANLWSPNVVAPVISNPDELFVPTHPVKLGEWQVHSVVFKKIGGTVMAHRIAGVEKMTVSSSAAPLSGFILGANVATKSGLACDVAELLVFNTALEGEKLAAVEKDLATRWGTPTDLPEAKQPKPPGLPDDPRIFRTTVRKQGDDGVHTYRIPGLATTPRGTLIAVFDIRHKNGGDLPGDIDVGMMRSTDDGVTWGEMQTIMDYDAAVPSSRGNGVGDPTVLVDTKTGAIFVAALWSKGPRAWAGSGPGMTPDETAQFVIVKSTDDGVTWSKPESITPQIKRPEWKLLFNGPGNGIQLRDGTLVFPAQFKDAGGVAHSCFIESRDAGVTWKISPPAIPERPPTSEAQIAECSDGSLLLTMRNEARTGQRAWARWKDGKWSDPWFAVTDPTCMASIIRHPKGCLIFSNPNNPARRTRMTIRHSADDGKTWSDGKLLDPSFSMYSCMTVLRDGQIGILYESGDTAGLVFTRFPLEWVLEK